MLEVIWYAIIALAVILSVWNLIRNIKFYLRMKRHRKEFHAHIRGVYMSHGLEPPEWAKE